MTSTKYLYDVDPSDLLSMSYPEALEYKVHKAKELRGKLLEVDYQVRDDERLNKVIKAIRFNEGLIEEMLGKEE